jgi:hypothetical protein
LGEVVVERVGAVEEGRGEKEVVGQESQERVRDGKGRVWWGWEEESVEQGREAQDSRSAGKR